MTRSFLPHLSTIFLLHVVALMGTWQLSQSSYVKEHISKVESGVLKLHIASNIMMNRPTEAKKVHRVTSMNRTQPQSVAKKATKVVATPKPSSQGSEFGTSAAGKSDSLSLYKAELRAMIDKNKYYPVMSRRLRQTGTVVVAFTLLKDGNIIDVRIEKPSRFERLNLSALDAVKKVERFKPIPKEVGDGKMDIKVPVKFVTI